MGEHRLLIGVFIGIGLLILAVAVATGVSRAVRDAWLLHLLEDTRGTDNAV